MEEHERGRFSCASISRSIRRMVSRQVNDVALGVLYKMCRSIMADSWRPQCVCFSYERPTPPDRAIYDRLFDCPMQFGSDFDGIVIDASGPGPANPAAGRGARPSCARARRRDDRPRASARLRRRSSSRSGC